MPTTSPILGTVQSLLPFVIGLGLGQHWFTSDQLSEAVNYLTQGSALAVGLATAISSALTTVVKK